MTPEDADPPARRARRAQTGAIPTPDAAENGVLTIPAAGMTGAAAPAAAHPGTSTAPGDVSAVDVSTVPLGDTPGGS
ncbi:hypothetical protein ACFFIR_17860, partial [Microbacterium arthrosphaerae]